MDNTVGFWITLQITNMSHDIDDKYVAISFCLLESIGCLDLTIFSNGIFDGSDKSRLLFLVSQLQKERI
jgi:hypothetical protein